MSDEQAEKKESELAKEKGDEAKDKESYHREHKSSYLTFQILYTTTGYFSHITIFH